MSTKRPTLVRLAETPPDIMAAMPKGRRRSLAGLAVLAAGAFFIAACTSGSDRSGGPSGESPSGESGPDVAAEEQANDVDSSDGCGMAPAVDAVGGDLPGDVALEFATDAGPRVYRLGVPEGYDPMVPTPLVVNLHGARSGALEAGVYSDVPRVASSHGVLSVAPEAIEGNWELGSNGDDDAFIIDLVDDIERRYCIDRGRVHLMGMSLGAWKAAITACAHPDRFASVALVTVEVYPASCEPMAMLAFHGTADLVAPYGEGGDDVDTSGSPNAGLPGARENVAAWAASGGCDPQPVVDEFGDDVTRWAYVSCDRGVDVELYTIDGGGHTWPGSVIKIGPPSATTDTIDATALAFDWFEAHPLQDA